MKTCYNYMHVNDLDKKISLITLKSQRNLELGKYFIRLIEKVQNKLIYYIV